MPSAPRPLLPVPSAGSPLYVGLLVEGVRHHVLEATAAGLSLAPTTAEVAGLGTLARGEERTVTLCVGGEGWEAAYDVTVRLAARGPRHVGLAFVTLSPAARRSLERYEAEREDDDGMEPERGLFAETGGPAPFAFARLVDPDAPPARRFILAISEAVFALTKRRSEPQPVLQAEPVQVAPAQPRPPIPASTVAVCAFALVALLAILSLVLFG